MFPFTYTSKPRQSCIVDYNGNTLWCATTDDYDTDGKWGNCYMNERKLFVRTMRVGRQSEEWTENTG